MGPLSVSACGCLPCTRSGAYCALCRTGTPCAVDQTEVALCCEWLALRVVATPKVKFTESSSYGYKHRVEEWLTRAGTPTHISNGAFIVAAVTMGFTVAARGANAFFAFRVTL